MGFPAIQVGGFAFDPNDPNDPADFSEFITINYTVYADPDRWDPNETWHDGAVIRLLDPNDPNDPNKNRYWWRWYEPGWPSTDPNDSYYWHILSINECKADLSNDGGLTFSDINPFAAALGTSDPNDLTQGYPYLYPGRGGSMIFKGDLGSQTSLPPLQCDELLNFADQTGFTLRLSEGCCLPTCGDCPDGDGLLAAQEMATQLEQNIRPELRTPLLYSTWQSATLLRDPEMRQYWREVYDIMTK